jgi:hypothetical protein
VQFEIHRASNRFRPVGDLYACQRNEQKPIKDSERLINSKRSPPTVRHRIRGKKHARTSAKPLCESRERLPRASSYYWYRGGGRYRVICTGAFPYISAILSRNSPPHARSTSRDSPVRSALFAIRNNTPWIDGYQRNIERRRTTSRAMPDTNRIPSFSVALLAPRCCVESSSAQNASNRAKLYLEY